MATDPLEELKQTGSVSETLGTEEDMHKTANSNQEELTKHQIPKVLRLKEDL
jgi:hypothetical protein